MAYKGDGTATNPILLESATPPSPVKILSGPRFRELAESIGEPSSDKDSLSEDEDTDNGGSESSEADDDQDEEESIEGSSDTDEDLIMNSLGVPIFERPPDKYSAMRIMKILLSSTMDENKIAYKRPIEVQRSSTFVVDLTKLAHPDDIKRDAYGRWVQNGSHTDVFKCSYYEDGEVYIDKVAPGASGTDVYYLRRLHCVHPSNNSFRRILAFICDSKNNPHRLCMAVYYLPDNFHPKPIPHGNSKGDKPFFPTLPSTMAMIKHESTDKGPKRVVEKVSSSLGGVLSASDISQLPRGEQQVSQAKRRNKSKEQIGSADDEFATVLHKAFMEDSTKQFIREIKTLREPAIVVARDQQISDLERFCTFESEFGIMTIDPTFSLGKFDVTVTTYRHLLLECRRTGDSPVFIGPSMIHFKKTFSTYLFFASTLVGLKPELCHLRCFGTDGEEALYTAFQHAFPESIHLQCFNHVRRNIKAKLQELCVCQSTMHVLMGDIFGRQVEMQQLDGLVDAVSEEEFDRGVQSLCRKWEQYDTDEKGPLHLFSRWFKTYKCHIIKKTMLHPVRMRAGLGNPPIAFTTNASESINALLKNQVEFKRSDVPVFLDQLQSAIDEQQKEVERAIIDAGKYKFRDQFKHLVKSEEEWFFRMSLIQKQNHIKRIGSLAVCPQKNVKGKYKVTSHEQGVRRRLFTGKVPPASQEVVRGSNSHSTSRSALPLSVTVESFCNQVVAQEDVLKAVWKKAEELINDKDAIVKAPGGTDFLVKSYSNPRPHLVKVKKGGQYCCDSDCPNWKSLGLCSHSVATAEKDGNLQCFVEWYKKAKKKPNLTKLVTTSMPKGRGHKGGKVPPKKKKKLTSSMRVPFSVTCDLSEQSSSQDNSKFPESSDDFDDGMTLSEDADDTEASSSSLPSTSRNIPTYEFPIASGSESTSDTDYTPHLSCSTQGSLMHTLTLSSGSSSQALAGSEFITHTISLPTGQASSRGSVSTNSMPCVPPPLIPCTFSPVNESPFTLAFISGNIRVCRGCRQKFAKPPSPPHDLCVRHQEWQEFTPTGGSFPQHRFGNVYYHCNLPCILARCAGFSSDQLVIPVSILVRLLPVHTSFIQKHMPGRL